MAQLPCIGLSWPLTNPPFGSAIYFPDGIVGKVRKSTNDFFQLMVDLLFPTHVSREFPTNSPEFRKHWFGLSLDFGDFLMDIL